MSTRNMLKGLTLVAILVLVGCGGGGGTEPTDTSLEFSLNPPGYFGGSYSDSHSLTGSYSNGDKATATLRSQSGSTTTFNGLPVLTIDQQVSITNTTSGANAADSSEGYYSTDLTKLTVVGGLSITDGVITMATSTSIIPLIARIGDFGNVGNYTQSDGKSQSRSWALEDGFNGKAKLVITTVLKDFSDALEATEVDTYTIRQNGTITHVHLTVTLHQLGNLVLTLTGS